MRTTAGGNTNQHSFAQIPNAQIPRSSFDRSSNYKTTLNSGYLYPIFVDEALPGDTINFRARLFARMNTMIFPVMDNLYLTFHLWAVPNRLLYNNWKKMMGEQDNPSDPVDYVTPKLISPVGGFPLGGMSDYMGIPPLATGSSTHTVCAFHHRAYNLVIKEWYRDENLQDSPVINTGPGPDAVADYPLRRRGKRKDYFTSALPWPQKGTAVTLPLGTTAPVKMLAVTPTPAVLRNYDTHATGGATSQISRAGSTGIMQDGGPNQLVLDPNGSLYADLAQATSATINALRTSIAIQRLYERDARGGTRYTEIIRSHFGVTSPDARLQRPEFLGGGQINISVNPVPQTGNVTSGSGGTRPLAALGAFGTAIGGIPPIFKSFTEHSVLLGLVSIRADLNYQQGENRMWARSTKYDFYWPALSHLGEQPILSREIYMDGTGNSAAGTGDYSVFGYQERWAEYRYKPSLITGKLRSTDPLTLDAWHLAQKFTARPTLGDTFIQENPPVGRVIATPTEPEFMLDGYFQMKHIRPMPTYSVPGLMDHF